MEEIMEIIKKIREIEKSNEDFKISSVIDNRDKTEQKKEYENSVEGELLQELDETKDFEKKRELYKQIKEIREKNIEELNERLNEKINKIRENLEAKENIIESNKKELYRMKSNRDMLLNPDSTINPERKAAYQSITEDMRNKIKENKELNKEAETLRKFINDIENKEYDKYIAKAEDKEATPEKVEENKEDDLDVETIKELLKAGKNKGNTAVGANLFNTEIVDDEAKNKITIYPDKVKVSLQGIDSEFDIKDISEEDLELIDNLSDEAKDNVDFSIVKALKSDRELLDNYLNMCELYNYKDKEINSPEFKEIIENFEITEDFPQIEYNFKDLRKDSNLSIEEKLSKYKQAKETKKMFKKMGVADKINIKASFLDKMYFEMKQFSQTLKAKIALPEATEPEEFKAEEVELIETAEPEKSENSIRTHYDIDEEKAMKEAVDAFHEEMKKIRENNEKGTK